MIKVNIGIHPAPAPMDTTENPRTIVGVVTIQKNDPNWTADSKISEEERKSVIEDLKKRK